MAGTGRQFVVELITKTKDAQKGLDDFGKKFSAFKVPILAGLALVAGAFAAVTTAIYKSVRAVIDLGAEFNDAYRTIRAGTGATGEELARLEDSFRNVFGTGADSMDDVARTMVELERRFDTMSNRRLERLTRQFLDLSGLLGEDTVGLVESLTGAFNRFEVPAHMASETLDTLFRIAQETGYSLTTLGSQTENYGVGLQRLGFDLNEAAAFLALLDREGVAASRIFPSLNTAAAKLAREGVGDVAGGIADLINDLQNLDEAAANARAAEMLGADYGNFLEVIRGTNFDYRGLLDLLGDSQGVITDTAAETDGLTEKWDTFKNFLKVELEPIATQVYGGLTQAVDDLIPAAQRVMEAYGEGGLQSALEQVAIEWQRIYGLYLEPLWIAFLAFLDEIVVPAALELGKKIGGALVSGIGSAFRRLAESAVLSSPFISDEEARALREAVDAARALEANGPRRSLNEILDQLQYDLRTRAVRMQMPTWSPELGAVPMAAGGIVTSPTLALIGEAGAEAVIPLSEMNEYGGSTVNVYVTSADPNAVVDAIRRYTRTNGPLGQVVSV